MPSKLLPASVIPPRFHESAFLVSKIPFKACVTDQRFSYCMYIPEEPYHRATPTSTLPLIVTIHGSSRRAETCRDVLIPLADHLGCAVLAPMFPTGIGDPNDVHNYKGILYQPPISDENETAPSIRYDQVLLSMLDEVRQRWGPGIVTDKVYLTGFSGGGQFALRFLYLHPERLHAVSIGAPGSITRLDASTPWPAGVADTASLFGSKVDIDAIRKVAIQLVVGELDTEVPGGGLKDWLRTHKIIPHEKEGLGADVQSTGQMQAQQLTSRKRALMELHDEFRDRGLWAELEIVEGVEHSMEGCVRSVTGFLEAHLQRRRSRKSEGDE